MTRAINVNLPEPEVLARCQSKSIPISAIETLQSGGTHFVCVTIDGADEARVLFKSAIIEGPVRRFAFLRSNPSRYR